MHDAVALQVSCSNNKSTSMLKSSFGEAVYKNSTEKTIFAQNLRVYVGGATTVLAATHFATDSSSEEHHCKGRQNPAF